MTAEKEILQILHFNPLLSRAEIAIRMKDAPQERTLKRYIAILVKNGYVIVNGKGPATKYSLSAQSCLLLYCFRIYNRLQMVTNERLV